MKDEKSKIPEETKMQIADRIGKKIKLSDGFRLAGSRYRTGLAFLSHPDCLRRMLLGLQGSCIHVTRTGHTPPPGSLLQIEWTSASAVSLSCNKVARSLSPPLSLSLRLNLHLTLSLPLNLILILTLTRLPSASTARDEERRPFPFENKARTKVS